MAEGSGEVVERRIRGGFTGEFREDSGEDSGRVPRRTQGGFGGRLREDSEEDSGEDSGRIPRRAQGWLREDSEEDSGTRQVHRESFVFWVRAVSTSVKVCPTCEKMIKKEKEGGKTKKDL